MNRRRNLPPLAVFGFLAPNLLGFLGFTLFPVLFSLYMAFTNWNLKPAVALEGVGLRNFADLLGVRPLEAPSPLLCWMYIAAAVVLCLGLVGGLWSNMANWRGTRTGGLILLIAGVVTVAMAILRPKITEEGARLISHGVLISGALGVLGGVATVGRDERWRIGLGTLPGALIALGGLGLWQLHASMWGSYEPRDPRFWQYFYNTVYLMLGIPFGIAGSLGLALLVNNELPFEGARPGPTLALGLRVVGAGICVAFAALAGLLLSSYLGKVGAAAVGVLCVAAGAWIALRLSTQRLPQAAGALVCLVCGIVTMVVVWGMGSPNVALLAGILWGMAALGIAFNVVAYRTVYYLPTFTAGVALMILWKALYNPETGPINRAIETVFGLFGSSVTGPEWLSSVIWAKPALIIMGVWTGIGGTNMLLYLAGLSNVPSELLDAADVDGASMWQRFRHVTWPQLAPTTFFISVMSVIGGLQGGFEQARVMTGGGPAGATTTLSYYIYNKAFQDLDLGYAAAISWVLFAIIFIATALNWKFGRELEVGQ